MSGETTPSVSHDGSGSSSFGSTNQTSVISSYEQLKQFSPQGYLPKSYALTDSTLGTGDSCS